MGCLCCAISNLLESIPKFPSGDFLAQIMATLIGAVLAFYFGLISLQIKERKENIGKLNYFISALAANLNSLYTLKRDFTKPRMEEIKHLKEQIEAGGRNILIKEMSLYIYGSDIDWPLPIEKCIFLTSPDPNIITLIAATKDATQTLNSMLYELNSEISAHMNEGPSSSAQPNFQMMMRKNELLYEQVDFSLFMTKKLIDTLIEFGKHVYKKDMKIRSMGLHNQDYKELEPTPVKSWHSYKWNRSFSPKKSSKQNLVTYIKKMVLSGLTRGRLLFAQDTPQRHKRKP